MAYKTQLKKTLALAVSLIMLAASLACGGNGGKEKQGDDNVVNILDISAEDYYRNGYTDNYIVGIDQFGRTFEAKTGDRQDKDRNVGIFYFCTLGQHGGSEIVDITKILAEEEDAVNKLFHENETYPNNSGAFFWGEPVWGYYNSADAWVIRRHFALLTMAGVDFIVFDTTNAVTYEQVVGRIITEGSKLKEAGWDIPGLVFYTNAYSHRVIEDLYNMYYKKGKYSDLWYYVDGKPLIIGNVSAADDIAEARGRGDKSYKPSEFSEEIADFFYFRESQWPSLPFRENGFPWIEWTYPAPVHNDVINVAVASHPALPMSFSVTRGAPNWGRGWNTVTKQNEPGKALEGQFFQATWDVALKEDPGTVFITGWNEWTAGKNEYDGEYAMVDLCNMEFSRDAEIMKGGYNDAFYIQMAKNIRDYKSSRLQPGDQLKSEAITVPMTSDLSAWDGVKAVFRDPLVVNKARKAKGAVNSLDYRQDAARNNITEVRVTGDGDYFYFLIKTDEDIAARNAGDSSWMNLFIGTGAVSSGGWEGYGFVVGRSETSSGKLSVEKLGADYSGTSAGEADFRIDGSAMQIRIPRSALGIDAGVNSFYFKVADGVENPSDIMDYYVSGRSFPLGRLSMRYLG